MCEGANWDVALVENRDGDLAAALPYFFQTKFGLRLLRQAILTPYLGALIYVPENMTKRSSILAFEKKMIFQLVEEIGEFDFFNQNFHPNITNTQPFAWKGFTSTVQYNFVIDLDKELDFIHADFESKTRSHIKKAKTELTLESSTDIDHFYDLTKSGFGHRGNKVPFTKQLLNRVYQSLIEQGKGTIWVVKDAAERVHAGALIVLDQEVIYTLQISSDPDLRSSGAVQFLIWEMIQKYHPEYKSLDFCGTMIERVEPVFRSFGSHQVPYFRISKEASKIYRLASFCKSLVH